MWLVLVVIVIALIIAIPRIKGQNAERKAGYGPRCKFCQSKLKYNADRTGWARVCKKCGREQ